MQFFEIEALIENLWMKNKESWEQTRTITYVTAQCQSSKKLDPNDLMTFPWEKERVKIEDTPEEREVLKEEMLEMERQLNKK